MNPIHLVGSIRRNIEKERLGRFVVFVNKSLYLHSSYLRFSCSCSMLSFFLCAFQCASLLKQWYCYIVNPVTVFLFFSMWIPFHTINTFFLCYYFQYSAIFACLSTIVRNLLPLFSREYVQVPVCANWFYSCCLEVHLILFYIRQSLFLQWTFN